MAAWNQGGSGLTGKAGQSVPYTLKPFPAPPGFFPTMPSYENSLKKLNKQAFGQANQYADLSNQGAADYAAFTAEYERMRQEGQQRMASQYQRPRLSRMYMLEGY